MDKTTLHKLIVRWMDAAKLINRIESVRHAGGSGSSWEPALDKALEDILELLQDARATNPTH